MKKVFAVGAALVSFPAVLFAADLPLRRGPAVYAPPPPPAFNWTGFYVGANAGAAFDGRQSDTITANDLISQIGFAGGFVAPYVSNRRSGFTGGGQLGYNYQIGSGTGVVVGVETDVGYTGLQSTGDNFGTLGDDTRFHSRTSYVGTLRGRVGYAFNQVLIYGTGGFAYGGVDDAMSLVVLPGRTTFLGAQSTIQTGYAYGGGIEYAVPTNAFFNFFQSGAVTVKAEFVHYDLGTSTFTSSSTVPPAGLSSFTNNVRTSGNLARLGINYKVDFAPTPVVARY